MKKMNFMQKVNFIFQNMKIEWYTLLAYPFLSAFVLVVGIELSMFKVSLLVYLIIMCIVFVIHFLAHLIESIGIIFKKVNLVDGTIYKTYNDYVHREDYGGTGRTGFYEKKYVSLFSDNVKKRRVPIPGKIRIQVKSTDEKYVSPWASITKRVFNNKEKYKFMIVIYNNIPVTIYREKNN